MLGLGGEGGREVESAAAQMEAEVGEPMQSRALVRVLDVWVLISAPTVVGEW